MYIFAKFQYAANNEGNLFEAFCQTNVFTASLLSAQHKKRDSVEKKLASLFVVSLSKALNEMSLPLCDRQVAHPYFTRLQL